MGVMTIWSPEASLQLQDCSASTIQPRQACVHCSAGRLEAKACRFTAITGAAQSQVAAVLVSGGAAIMQSCKLRADAAVCVVVTGVNGPAVFEASQCDLAFLEQAGEALEDCGVETLGQACLVEGERSTAQLLRCNLGPHTRRGKWRLGGSIELFALLTRTMREALQRHDTFITTDEVLDDALCWQAGPAASGAATAVSDEGSKASCEQGATALAPEPVPIKPQDDTEQGGNGAGSRTHRYFNNTNRIG
ncbi:hypothetical protein HaLaN_27541 [Haematococcus lacustris]|uniref:Uncharacterized protein n=1 Tax=Haematococcus lacustris TaxID=44745 RepID=A0A6A0A965_HAELA|nr:hypothetical protein HaLaN_27541 [Haematococcus lacustris]